MRVVTFLSQSEAERITPEPGSAIISITDPDKPLVALPLWDSVYRESFYDGGYSDYIIQTFKGAFRLNYASYIDSNQARRLAKHIDDLVASGCNEIFVHCYFGESRSGAVALYLHHRHGYVPNKKIRKPNRTVYELLIEPNKYEPLIQSFETQDIEPESSLLKKMWYLVLEAIGVKDQSNLDE